MSRAAKNGKATSLVTTGSIGLKFGILCALEKKLHLSGQFGTHLMSGGHVLPRISRHYPSHNVMAGPKVSRWRG